MKFRKDVPIIYKKIYYGYYEVSNTGIVRRAKPGGNATYVGKVLRPSPNTHGYPSVCLNIRDKGIENKVIPVHILVARAFIKKKLKNTEVNHKDGNKLNSTLRNFEYLTRKENMRHAAKLGLRENCFNRGEKNGSSKLNIRDIIKIRKLSNRYTYVELAKMFYVTPPLIRKICLRKLWRHV